MWLIIDIRLVWYKILFWLKKEYNDDDLINTCHCFTKLSI